MIRPEKRNSNPALVRALVVCAGIAIPCLLAPSAAQAASRQAQERAARKACLTGDYAKGVAILSDLFLDTKDATYIFNQGRCFEQNRRFEDAIGRFEEYLRASANPKLEEADKTAAEKHIADCRARLGLPAEQPTAPPAQPQVATAPAAPPVAALPPAPVSMVTAQPAPAQGQASTGAGLRTAGIVTASVGGAALIAGVLLNVKVNGMASDMQSTPGGYSAGKESDRKTYETLGWASYGVGAACVATGAVLYVLGLRAARGSTSSVALVPAFAPGQAGALLKGAF